MSCEYEWSKRVVGHAAMGVIMRLKEFQELCFFDKRSGLLLDLRWSGISKERVDALQEKMAQALKDMQALESGAIANPDEKRMVGHYWLRNSSLAPTEDLSKAIDNTLLRVKQFTANIHNGKILTLRGEKFQHVLLIGIGGSALGPQHVYQALRSPRSDPMDLFFFDNTDPDGMQRVLDDIPDLAKTLVLVISKSGGTKETRNGQLIAKDALDKAGLSFNGHFVAVTGEGSELDKTAQKEGWLESFPMWDWVGGRTSETSAVGLLPAALHGADIDELLRGAREMDELTRRSDLHQNPAALLSVAWYELCEGKGTRAMVVLPYCDRLVLFSKYLQQLIMESLGKKLDLDGNVVHQGISVYGNKGSTDQHAYVQQLRDGLDNFFVTFVEVLKDISGKRDAASFFVEEGITSGDYLGAFLQGARQALYDEGRPSITITVDEITPYSVGSLIALFERAVGFYASLVNINAYHQPGVEAGKKAAGVVLDAQKRILAILAGSAEALTAAEISGRVAAPEQTVASLLRRLAANGRVGVEKEGELIDWRYRGI